MACVKRLSYPAWLQDHLGSGWLQVWPGAKEAGRTQREHESLNNREAPISPEAACPVYNSWTIGAELAHTGQDISLGRLGCPTI